MTLSGPFGLSAGLRLLSDDDLAKIHEASCVVLEKVGAKAGHPRMLRILEGVGLPVDYQAERVAFPRSSVERFLDQAKRKREALGAPTSSNLPPAKVTLAMGGGQSLIHDLDANVIRAATKDDLVEATVIGDYYQEVGSIANLVNPTDVHAPVNDIHMWDVLLRRTTKFTAATVTNRGSVEFILEMLAVVAGSVDEVIKRRMFRKICFMFSPLRVPREELEVGFEMLDRGLDVVIGHPIPCVGVHTPITLAGALASVNAEALAGLIMTEALRQEFAMPYHCATAVTMNPRTAITLAASPEFMLMNAACSELARYYGLGGDGFYGSAHTDSPAPDYQAGFEVGASMMMGIFFGCSSFSVGTLGPAHEVVCLPKIPLDVDAAGYCSRWLQRIEVNDETLPLDLILRIAGGDGCYIAEEHTVGNLRRACWDPRLLSRAKPSEFMDKGMDLLAAARREVRRILETHDPHPLSPEQESEMSKIVRRAEQAKGVA